MQERLYVLADGIDISLQRLLLRLGLLSHEDFAPGILRFGKVRIHEEIDACAHEGPVRRVRRGPQSRRICIGEECRHDRGLGHDGAIVVQRGHESSWVNSQKFGRAGNAQIDDGLFVWNLECCQRNVRPVGPCVLQSVLACLLGGRMQISMSAAAHEHGQ
jgi:hypothetical protein